MAARRELSLCDVLCFVSNKFVKLPVKQLKSILSDFYTVEVLTEAKVRLLSDIESMEASVQIPHVPRRRDGDNRVAREVDDIVTLFQFVDENKLLANLPMYVSGSPDLMPSARLFEGDLNIVMAMLEKMGHKVEEFGSALSAIVRDVGKLQSKFMSLDEFPPLPAPAAPVGLLLQPRQQRPVPQSQPQQPQTRELTGLEIASGNSTRSAANDVCSRPSLQSDTQWSMLASTPQQSNRFAVLASTDDDEQRDEEQPFTVVRPQRSTRTAAKRQRQQSAVQPARQAEQLPAGRQGVARITGKSSAATLGLRAAKKTVTKAVFCVDNVDLECKEDDIRAYVSGLGVEVFSCFKTKPRRRPHEAPEDVLDRSAFRVCVNATGRDRLLNPESWPDSVRIADWFFRDRNNQVDNEEKRRRVDPASPASPTRNNVQQARTRVEPAAAAAATAVSSVAEKMDTITTSDEHDVAGQEIEQDRTVDQTTLYQYGEC